VKSRLGIGLVVGTIAVSGCASSANSQSPPQFQLPAGCHAQPPNTDPDVTPPRISHRVEPKVSLSDPAPAYACLEAVVQVDGTLTDVKVVKSSGTAMTTEALAAVREWRYVPATRNGVAIPYPINIAFTMTMSTRPQ
jgi:TonB family protein